MGLQVGGVAVQGIPGLGSQGVLVEIKMNPLQAEQKSAGRKTLPAPYLTVVEADFT